MQKNHFLLLKKFKNTKSAQALINWIYTLHHTHPSFHTPLSVCVPPPERCGSSIPGREDGKRTANQLALTGTWLTPCLSPKGGMSRVEGPSIHLGFLGLCLGTYFGATLVFNSLEKLQLIC